VFRGRHHQRHYTVQVCILSNLRAKTDQTLRCIFRRYMPSVVTLLRDLYRLLAVALHYFRIYDIHILQAQPVVLISF
jgi:hypothetical protein